MKQRKTEAVPNMQKKGMIQHKKYNILYTIILWGTAFTWAEEKHV